MLVLSFIQIYFKSKFYERVFFLTLTQKLPLSNTTYSTLCVCWCIANSQYLKFTGAAPVFSIKVRTSSYEHTNEWKGNSYVHNHENFSANKQQKLTMYVEPNMDRTTKWQRHLYSCTISTHMVPSPIVPTQFKAFSFKNSWPIQGLGPQSINISY